MFTQRISLGLIFLSSALAHGHQTGSVNHITTDAELNKMLSSGKAVVVKFEADWCGPCKASRSPYAKIAQNHTDVLFAAVNVDNAKSLGSKYSVSSLPTFVIFDTKGKQVKKMTGFHSTEILNTIKEFEGTSQAKSAPKKEEKAQEPAAKKARTEKKEPAKKAPAKKAPAKGTKCPTGTVTAVKDMNHFESVINGNQFVVAKFEADWCAPCKEATEPYAYMAEDYKDVVFLTVDTDENKNIGGKYQIKSLPTFIIFKNGDEADRMVSFFDPALRAKIDDVRKGTKSAMAQVKITNGPVA